MAHNEIITIHTTSLASELVILEPQSRVRFLRVLWDVRWRAVPWRECRAKNVPTKNLRPRRWGAWALVFVAIIVSIVVRMVAMGGLLPLIPPLTPAGVYGVSHVVDGADTFVYRDRDTPSTIVW
jgi:hypothetical protein